MKRSFQRQVLAEEIVPDNRLNRLRNQIPERLFVVSGFAARTQPKKPF
jgi:hypothetical protein